MASGHRVLQRYPCGTLEHARFRYYGFPVPRSRDAHVNWQAICTAYDHICPCVVLLWVYWVWYWLYRTVGYVIHSGFVGFAYVCPSGTRLENTRIIWHCAVKPARNEQTRWRILSHDPETDARAVIATYYNNINNKKKLLAAD